MITRYHVPAPSYKSEIRFGHCQHADMRLVVSTKSNGNKLYQRQCFDCGHKEGELAYAKLTKAEMDAAIPRIHLVETIRERQADDEYIAQARWWGWYNEYLKSPVWRAKREKVFARAKNTCEACGDAPAYQVHHLTYDNVGREPLFDLVAVCAECHKILHDKETP